MMTCENRLVRIEPTENFPGYNLNLSTMRLIGDDGQEYQGLYRHGVYTPLTRMPRSVASELRFIGATRKQGFWRVNRKHYLPFRVRRGTAKITVWFMRLD